MRKLTDLTPPPWFAVALSLSIHLVDLFHLGYEGSLRHLEHKIFVSILQLKSRYCGPVTPSSSSSPSGELTSDEPLCMPPGN